MVTVECGECSRLLAEEARLNRAHTVAFDKMLAASHLSSTEFFLAKATNDEARLDAEVSRLEVEQHKRIHSRARLAA